jgi:peptidoglycan/LPS O-acetylase OafA/YrhL
VNIETGSLPRSSSAERGEDVRIGRDVDGINTLRALAALAVVWFHFTLGNPWLVGSVLQSTGRHGWAGAEVFFVISGFVVPWAMESARYSLSAYPGFVARRLARLHPPYLASIALTTVLDIASRFAPGFRGQPFSFSWHAHVVHALLLNAWLDVPWINPVYWTLAIELQLYLLLGLAFPLFSSTRGPVRWVCLSAFILGSCFSDPRLAFAFGSFFGLGFATFLFRRRKIGLREYAWYLVLAAGCFWTTGKFVHAIAGLGAALAIVAVRSGLPWLERIGVISYSLYLIHVPLGGRVINLAARFFAPTVLAQIAVLAVAVALSLGSALLLYWAVERPAHRWAKRIAYADAPGTRATSYRPGTT